MGRAGEGPERCEWLPARRDAWVLLSFKSIQLNNKPMTLIVGERPGCVQDGGKLVHGYQDILAHRRPSSEHEAIEVSSRSKTSCSTRRNGRDAGELSPRHAGARIAPVMSPRTAFGQH